MSQILHQPNLILSQPTKRVETIDDGIRRLVDRMIDVMHEAKGVGLAANQIGVPLSIFVWDLYEGEGPKAVINPQLMLLNTEASYAVEGCLSIPGKEYKTLRFHWVGLSGITPDCKTLRMNAEGLLARVFQHEMAHLNGKLISSEGVPI